MKIVCLTLSLFIVLTGCTTVQRVHKLGEGKVSNICIGEHKEVREDVLKTIEEGLTRHGVKYRVIPAGYKIIDNLWRPTVQNMNLVGCDAVLFYVANWTWDVTMYMHFANIWMLTPDLSTRLGDASYDSRASLKKYINAHNKIIELMDDLFAEYTNSSTLTTGHPEQLESPVNIAKPAAVSPEIEKTNSAPVNHSSTTLSDKLRELQNLRKDGLITEEEYQQKKKELLDKM